MKFLKDYFEKREFMKRVNKCLTLDDFKNEMAKHFNINTFVFISNTRQLRQDFKSVYVTFAKDAETVIIYKDILLISHTALIWALQKNVPVSVKKTA